MGQARFETGGREGERAGIMKKLRGGVGVTEGEIWAAGWQVRNYR